MVKIDLSYLESIAGGDKIFIKEMLEMFNKSTIPEIINIEKFAAIKNWEKLGVVAHKIKAPLQMIGQTETYDLILELEKNAKNKINLDDVDHLIALIKIKMDEIKNEINKVILSLKK